MCRFREGQQDAVGSRPLEHGGVLGKLRRNRDATPVAAVPERVQERDVVVQPSDRAHDPAHVVQRKRIGKGRVLDVAEEHRQPALSPGREAPRIEVDSEHRDPRTLEADGDRAAVATETEDDDLGGKGRPLRGVRTRPPALEDAELRREPSVQALSAED